MWFKWYLNGKTVKVKFFLCENGFCNRNSGELFFGVYVVRLMTFELIFLYFVKGQLKYNCDLLFIYFKKKLKF